MIDLTYISPSGETVDIAMDAVLDELHRSSALITQHPVEEGASISDHVRPDQDTLTMTVFITNAPIRGDISASVQGQFEEVSFSSIVETPPKREGGPKLVSSGQPTRRLPFGGRAPGVAPRWEASELLEARQDPSAPSATVLIFPEVFNRVNFVYGVMHALMHTGTDVRIVTKLRTYENILIENLETPVTVETGDAIKFSVTLKQIRIVSTQTVAAPPTPEETRGRSHSNDGGQQTDEATENEEDNASLWMRLSRQAGLL